MQRVGYFSIAALALLSMATAGTAEEATAKTPDTPEPQRRVLIVTGEDYQGHKWKLTTPVLLNQLATDTRLDVEVTEDLARLRSPKLEQYDVVVVHFKNYDPKMPGREGFDNLARFVKQGGGLVLVHFACGAFQEFKGEFQKLAGRAWNPKLRGHDPYGRFRVEIVGTDHAVTHGLTAFETNDELYTCLDGDTPISVLAEARSKVDGRRYPMAFVLQYGEGRVFHSVLGHDARALSVPAVGELFRRGCAWAAGLDPSRDGKRGRQVQPNKDGRGTSAGSVEPGEATE